MQISTAKVRREGPRKNPSFESERASLRLWQAQDVMKRLSFLDHGTSRNRPREMKHGGGAVYSQCSRTEEHQSPEAKEKTAAATTKK